MSELDDALEQVREIHRHAARAAVYKGYRAAIVALSGVVGVAAGVAGPYVAPGYAAGRLIFYWSAIAAFNIGVCGTLMLYRFLRRETQLERVRTLAVAGQFTPLILAGALVSAVFYSTAAETQRLLPGIWALLFALGIVGLRPYLPALTILGAAWYLAAAVLLFAVTRYEPRFFHYGMGLAFGGGQLLSAGILYFTIERKKDER